MARIATKWLMHLNIFEIYKTPHLVELCLPLALITAIGFATPRAWSQDSVIPPKNTDTSSHNTTAEENAEVQPSTVISDEAPTTLPNTNSMPLPANTAPLEKETAAETTPPPLSAGMKSTSQPSTPDTTADGTVSVVIQPDNTTPPPNATKTQSTAPPTQPQNSATAVHSETPPASEKTTATMLLEGILEPLDLNQISDDENPRSSNLYARPLPLIEALQRSGDRSRRLWITQAYWQVSRGYASIRFATEAKERLQFIAPGSDPHDQMVLDVAIAAAEADLADAHAELIAAQQQLIDLVRLPVSEPAPWPVDRPLAGQYETHFAAIFATRPATGRIRAIDQMLPSKHDAVEARAGAVVAAKVAMDRAEIDHARAKRPIEAVVAAHRMLRQQQREFAESLATYNLDIAEYAMAVADVSVPDDRYVSMLIGTPIQWTPQPMSTVIPATNLQPIEQPGMSLQP
tara:strand:+ start:220 stop:1599 length:1380 start_codon:yes stop_codon:yes gene_type:complete